MFGTVHFENYICQWSQDQARPEIGADGERRDEDLAEGTGIHLQLSAAMGVGSPGLNLRLVQAPRYELLDWLIWLDMALWHTSR